MSPRQDYSLGNIISIYRLFDYTDKANEIKEIFSNAIESAINEYKNLRRRYMEAGREGYVEFYDYLIASFNCTSLPVAEDHFSFLDIEEPRRNPKKTIPFFSLGYIYAWKSEAHEFPSKCRIDEYLVDVGDPVVWNMDFDLTDCDITCYKCKKNLYKMNHGEILVNENGGIDTVPSIDYGIPMVSPRHYSYQDNGKNIIPAEEERILIGKVPYSKEKNSEFEQDFINNYVIYKMYNYHCK